MYGWYYRTSTELSKVKQYFNKCIFFCHTAGALVSRNEVIPYFVHLIKGQLL